MKILMVVLYGLNNGAGTERVCSVIANSLSEVGHEIILASIGPSDKPFFPINQEIQIISLEYFPYVKLGDATNITNKVINKFSKNINLIYRIRSILKKEDVDILIAVDTLSVQFTLPAALGLKVKHIAWEHFNFEHSKYLNRAFIARHLAARYCDLVVTLTEKDKNTWLESTRHKSQIVNIANPCPFPVQNDVEKSEKSEKSEKIVLAVGRLHNQKGFDLLLEAWLKVIKIMPNWKLKIVGEGQERVSLTNFIEENKLTDSVKLVGMTSDISHYYEEAEIFCLSSRIEGFGMVLTEALAFGLPIVSYNCGPGPAEILEDTGSILVPKEDVNQLASSLISLMKNDKQRAVIKSRGKEKVKIYQPDNIINKWLELLREL